MYFGMRWGFSDSVCQNYGRLGYDAVHSGKRVEEFRRSVHLCTEYAGNSHFRNVGTIYQTIWRHIPNYRNFSSKVLLLLFIFPLANNQINLQ
jgi:hypothetical protein